MAMGRDSHKIVWMAQPLLWPFRMSVKVPSGAPTHQKNGVDVAPVIVQSSP